MANVKITDPAEIKRLQDDFEYFWGCVQVTLRINRGDECVEQVYSFWKEYCGLDFNQDPSSLNLVYTYRKGSYDDGKIFFSVKDKTFKFTSYGLTLVRKRNPYITLSDYWFNQSGNVSGFKCAYNQLHSYVREIKILNAIAEYIK